jgi:hypothetical protein
MSAPGDNKYYQWLLKKTILFVSCMYVNPVTRRVETVGRKEECGVLRVYILFGQISQFQMILFNMMRTSGNEINIFTRIRESIFLLPQIQMEVIISYVYRSPLGIADGIFRFRLSFHYQSSMSSQCKKLPSYIGSASKKKSLQQELNNALRPWEYIKHPLLYST